MGNLVLTERSLVREDLLAVFNRAHVHFLSRPFFGHAASYQRFHHLFPFTTVILIILCLLHEHHFQFFS